MIVTPRYDETLGRIDLAEEGGVRFLYDFAVGDGANVLRTFSEK